MSRVCVTGAAGFIASHVIIDLLEDGHVVHATVRDLGDDTKRAHLDVLEERYPGKLQCFEADLLEPGSLDADNDEAIDSGAWWFYAHLGFRPRDKEATKLADTELRRAEKKGYRSSKVTLRELADYPVYFWLARERQDVLPVVCTDTISLGVLDYVSNRFGSRREDAARHCSQHLADALGVDSIADWPADEQLMWHRLSLVIAAIADVQDWPQADRAALVDVIRAKGGVREKDYVALFDAHKRLRRAVAAFAAKVEASE